MNEKPYVEFGRAWSELFKHFEEEIVPMAAQLSIWNGLSYLEFSRRLSEEGEGLTVEEKYPYFASICESLIDNNDSKSSATFQFAVLRLTLGSMHDSDNLASPMVRDSLHRFHGYLRALVQIKSDTVARGVEGRRKIGDKKKDAIRAAAVPYMGIMKKEKAAPKIAEAVGSQPSYVRKLLSELFPGEAWGDSSDGDTPKPSA